MTRSDIHRLSSDTVVGYTRQQSQAGFTLLELLVAMTIFAVISVAGWQITDALTKSRDRAKTKIATLRALQYAYESMAQDLAQTSNYVAVPVTSSGTSLATIGLTPTFTLTAQGITFTRMAAPDPRMDSMDTSPLLSRIGYSIVENKLIKRKYDTLLPSRLDNPATSVLLTDISEAKWSAITASNPPNTITSNGANNALNTIDTFPDSNTRQKNISALPPVLNSSNLSMVTSATAPTQPTVNTSAYRQLPQGIELQFTYQQQPIVWRFALPAGSPNSTGLNLTVGGK